MSAAMSKVGEDLTELAKAISAEGAVEDSKIMLVLNGIKDGVSELAKAVLAKSKDDDTPPKDDEEGEGKGGKKKDEDEDDDETGTGYADLAQADANGNVDVTAFIGKVGKDVGELVKLAKAQSKSLDVATKTLNVLRQRIESQDGVIAAQSRVLGELAKGSIATHRSVLDISEASPAAATGSTAAARDKARRRLIENKRPEANPLAKDLLVKARMKGVIDEIDMHTYGKTGRFDDDDAVHATKVKAVEALALRA